MGGGQSGGGGGGLLAALGGLPLPLQQGEVVGDLGFQRGAVGGGLRLGGDGVLAPQQSGDGKANADHGEGEKGEVEKGGTHAAAQDQQDADDHQQRRGHGGRGDGVQPGLTGGLIAGEQRVRGAAGRGIVRFGLSGMGFRLGLTQGGLGGLQGGALALHPGQQGVLRQGRGGFRQQPCGLALGLLGGGLRLTVLADSVQLLALPPEGLLSLQLFGLLPEAVQLLLGGGRLPGQVVPVGALGLQVSDLPLQHRDLAGGAVAAAAVELLFQAVPHLRIGRALLAGGDQGGDAALQLRVAVHGKGALPDKGTALENLAGDAQQRLAGVLAVDAGDGVGGAGIGAGEMAHGSVGTAGIAGQGQAHAAAVCDVHLSPHGGAAPRRKAVLVRQRAPVAGAEAVQHDPQEVAPGGFARFVGGIDAVQARLQLQGLILQFPECGAHFLNLHGAFLLL